MIDVIQDPAGKIACMNAIKTELFFFHHKKETFLLVSISMAYANLQTAIC